MWWNTIDRHLSLFEASKNLLILPKYLETRLQSSMINFLLSIFPYFLISIRKKKLHNSPQSAATATQIIIIIGHEQTLLHGESNKQVQAKKNILLNSN